MRHRKGLSKKYLSRYAHGVAISNHRIRGVANGVARFAYRDYADHNQRKQMALPAIELLRRLLQHVVLQLLRYRYWALCR